MTTFENLRQTILDFENTDITQSTPFRIYEMMVAELQRSNAAELIPYIGKIRINVSDDFFNQSGHAVLIRKFTQFHIQSFRILTNRFGYEAGKQIFIDGLRYSEFRYRP